MKIGDKLPYFELPDQNGNIVRSEDLAGKKVVIYFYPKDNTSGCTAQACSLRDNHDKLLQSGYTIIGISKDSVKSHKNFETKYNLPFTLLSDVSSEVIQAFGVYGEKKMYGRTYMGTVRTTFIFNEQGILERIIDKVDTKNHGEQIL